MNAAVLIMSSVFLTSTPDIVQVQGCEGCGTAAALPAACTGCGGGCATGICPGGGDPNPNEKTGLWASLKKRLTPKPRSSSNSCCGASSSGRTGLGIFQGGLLGKLRGEGTASAPTGCNGKGCGNSGCSEPPLVIGHTPVNTCALPPAPVMASPVVPQTMPVVPTTPMGESRPMDKPKETAPTPTKEKEKGSATLPVIPNLPSVPLSPATGPAASTGKPRF